MKLLAFLLLYSSISFGLSLQKAFDQAKAEMNLENIAEENIPQIFSRNDINLNNLILVNPNSPINNKSIFKCKNCGHIMIENSISCEKCYSNKTEKITLNMAYEDTINECSNLKKFKNEFLERLKLFSKHYSNDYRTYHLKFIESTSNNELYDCYRYDNSEFVNLINKLINSTPQNNDIKLKFINLYTALNERSTKEWQNIQLKKLEDINNGKKDLLNFADKIYDDYFTGCSFLESYFTDIYKLYSYKINGDGKEEINKANSHLKFNKKKLNEMNAKLSHYKSQRMDALNDIKERFMHPAEIIETLHKYVVWILIVFVFLISFKAESYPLRSEEHTSELQSPA